MVCSRRVQEHSRESRVVDQRGAIGFSCRSCCAKQQTTDKKEAAVRLVAVKSSDSCVDKRQRVDFSHRKCDKSLPQSLMR